MMGMKKKVTIIICLIIAVCFAVTFGITLKRIIDNERNGKHPGDLSTENASVSDDGSDSSGDASDLTSDDTDDANTESSDSSDSSEDTTDENTTQDSESDSENNGSTTSGDADSFIQSPPEGFFRETLFIGDSRTVGLRDYGNIPDAVFFADSGMSVYNIKSKSVNVPGVGNTNLQSLLSGGKYKRIYMMLGINELGYPDMDKAVAKYGELIDTLKAAQPEADIIVEANLHVAESTSSSHQYFTNSNINTLNQKISAFADNEGIFYIDVNPLFDDENGNLDKKYTYNDDFHLSGKYYKTWADWIATQATVSAH